MQGSALFLNRAEPFCARPALLIACGISFDFMHPQTIKEIVGEISAALVNRNLGAILQLEPHSLAIDFRSRDKDYLFLSVDPALPRIYLISRPQRQLEKQSRALSAFGQAVRSNLAGSKLLAVHKDEQERIVRLSFRGDEETGETHQHVLVAQLTGRSANLLLLDEEGIVLHTLRSLKGEGQQVGTEYAPPPTAAQESPIESTLQKGSFASLSAAADAFYQDLEANRAFDAQAAGARARLRQEIARLKKLRRHLESDLAGHGEPEQHKRLGDLLLANIATAERQGNQVRVTDFYAVGSPIIEIEVDEHTTLQDEAGRFFALYSKAKRAKQQIAVRIKESDEKLEELKRLETVLEEIVVARDDVALTKLIQQSAKKKGLAAPKKEQLAEKIPGVRRYLSSDGYEVLVGRGAKDNDHLTFRVARAYDLWLHSADYPGSHVIVRNPKRQEVPHRTLIEAAQLAAKFSQAGSDAKVNVHHTQRKFVSKIKGGAPGLVRLSSFKTITVQPAESIERI
jgi:predicted ribosome quality control (RQC) complex YloA/Tae2 family protein